MKVAVAPFGPRGSARQQHHYPSSLLRPSTFIQPVSHLFVFLRVKGKADRLPRPAPLPKQFLLLFPRSGCALVRVRLGPGVVCCCGWALGLGGCSSGSGVPAPCRCLVGGHARVLVFGLEDVPVASLGSRFTSLFLSQGSFSLPEVVALKNSHYGYSASLQLRQHQACKKLGVSSK